MKVYLDDERPTPEGWVRTYSVQETIDLINTGKVVIVSLDNDLGEGNPEGYKVVDWLEEKVFTDPLFRPPSIRVHSANPVRAQYMRQAIDYIERVLLTRSEEGT